MNLIISSGKNLVAEHGSFLDLPVELADQRLAFGKEPPVALRERLPKLPGREERNVPEHRIAIFPLQYLPKQLGQ